MGFDLQMRCSVAGCVNPAKTRGWCSKHSQRFYRTGSPYGVRKTVIIGTLADRLWARVEKHPTCWLWQGSVTSAGYGSVGEGGKILYAHRVAWELANERPVPDGMELDHLCRTRNCVNPDHLEPVSHRVNATRRWDVQDAI